jgi:alpha-methylacyl-CoA racemase
MLLADAGADVLRITRHQSPAERDNVMADLSLRSRKSVAADLKSNAGMELVLNLVERADVLVEGCDLA